MHWVEAASPELENNKAALNFLDAASRGKLWSDESEQSLRVMLIDEETKQAKSVIFDSQPLSLATLVKAIKEQFKWQSCGVVNSE